MKDYPLTKNNLNELFNELQKELVKNPLLVVTSQSGKTGKWGLAKLWRTWMASTADFMAEEGVTMPLMTDKNGRQFGKRRFNAKDAHELFTHNWLRVNNDGERLSWSKQGRDGMRAATKEERYYAISRHEVWCVDKGLTLFNPRDSEYAMMQEAENQC